VFNFIFKIERWKFNKTYQVYVSNQGRFRNKSKADLPIKIGNGGYCYVKVDCATCHYMLAHRLVMLTWRPTPDAENLTVDHKDHNKRNNALSNLEWVSYEENQERAKDDLVEVISKEAFNKLVEAEVNKRLGIIIDEATGEPVNDESDIYVWIGEKRQKMKLWAYMESVWDGLHINIKIKGGNTKPTFYQYLLKKIHTNKMSRLDFFRMGNTKIYFK
jgi:hypothetical protein